LLTQGPQAQSQRLDAQRVPARGKGERFPAGAREILKAKSRDGILLTGMGLGVVFLGVFVTLLSLNSTPISPLDLGVGIGLLVVGGPMIILRGFSWILQAEDSRLAFEARARNKIVRKL
jgi:hypothetical protein